MDKKKIRLVYFGVKYYPSRGGVSRTIENLIKELKDEFDITIYCYKHSQSKKYFDGVSVIQFPELPLGGIGVFIYFFLCYFHLMFFGKHDLVHVHKIDAAFFIPLLRLKFKNIVATSHESPYRRDKWNTLARTYFKFNERIFLRSKATLTVISRPLSEFYKKTYNRDVLYLPNGVEIPSSFNDEAFQKLMKENNITKPYIFFAARRIMSTKGCHTMLEALALKKEQKDIVIAGDLKQVPKYVNQLNAYNDRLNLHFIGYISDKPTLLNIVRNSEMFIFPSETEGMSIMLLEVAVTGTPIIASDIPENTAIIYDDEVVFFKDKDPYDLKEKLVWAENNPSELTKRAAKAKTRITNEYSGEIMTLNYKKIYIDAVSFKT